MNDLSNILSFSHHTSSIKRLGHPFICQEIVIFDKISNNYQINTLQLSEIIEKSTIRLLEIDDFLEFTDTNRQNYVIMITSIDKNSIKGIGFHSNLLVTCNHIPIEVTHIDNTLIIGSIPSGLIQVENTDGHFDRIHMIEYI